MSPCGEQFVKAASVLGSPTTPTCIGLASDVMANFGRLRIRATGGSMLPAIAAGDLLEFRTCGHGEIEPGQVVLVRCQSRLVAHRVMEKQATALLTRGDALTASDAPVSPEDVLGVLIGQQRGRNALHAGGRYWLRRQRMARWLIRRIGLIHRLFSRVPALVALTA